MNVKRFIIATIAVAIFTFAYEFVFHGILLKDMYKETAHLWRTEAQMKEYFHWCMITLIAFSLIVTYMFVRTYEGQKKCEGLRYGMVLGALLGVVMFGSYSYMPISLNLALIWLAGLFVEGAGIGVVLGLTYKK